MASLKVVGILCIVAAACALPAQEEARASRNAIQTENDLLDSIYADCLRKDSISCVKYKLFSFVDKMLGNRDTITITDGLTIVKTEDGETEGAPRALNGDDTVESLIFNRIQRFLDTHRIKVDLKGSEIVDSFTSAARSFGDVMDGLNEDDNSVGVEEGRGKKKKGSKLLGPLLAAGALKAAILGKLALAAIALIAGKALLIGKIALVLSLIIGLKKLLGGGNYQVLLVDVCSLTSSAKRPVPTPYPFNQANSKETFISYQSGFLPNLATMLRQIENLSDEDLRLFTKELNKYANERLGTNLSTDDPTDEQNPHNTTRNYTKTTQKTTRN
ncbi:hypothetical protein ILUMI_00321 [Ignelater luminosus]|uniref:Uncharacterized protein n=1 Tax=Ignelater luminosus TaxID=2038154 RepID=A0A8K0GMR3_IGNLU|nr:hypothetical protein ILUMI_00321 [Ignelater luminosus]